MDKQTKNWLSKLINNTGLRIKKKFTAGDKEHDSQFLNMTKDELIDEAMDEVLDLITYIARIKELK